MSNCYLKNISAFPGKLSPAFSRNCLEYHVVLDINDSKTTIDITPEFYNDVYKMIGNMEEDSHQIHVSEGSSKVIEIIVHSEHKDNCRTYILYISRISSKLAFLDNVVVHPGKLIPNFDSNIYYYKCIVGAGVSSIRMHFDLPDVRCMLHVNQEEPKSNYDINIGITSFKIKIYSVDESHSKKYMVDVHRKEIPRYIFISDPMKRLKYEDPISLSPMYCPTRVPDYDIWSQMSMSSLRQIMDMKRIHYGKSVFENKDVSIQYDYDIEKKMSELKGRIPLTYGGFSHEQKLSHIGGLLHKCNELSPFKSFRWNKISAFLENFDLNPKWQMKLLLDEIYDIGEDYDEDGGEKEKEDKDILTFEDIMLEYLFYLPITQVCDGFNFPPNENPIKHLQEMIFILVKGLRDDVNNSDLHMILGLLLEESFMIEDTLNIKTELFRNESDDTTLEKSKNQTIINALCKKKGFKNPPTLCQQLRTLLDEHTVLISKSLMREADEIQNIIEWRSKEASQEGKIAIMVSDTGNPIGKAAVKYFTALKMDLNSAVKNFHVARMMIFEGKYGEAIIRLEHALTLTSDHWPSRFLLGFAQANLIKITEQKLDRTIELLLEGTEKAISDMTNYAILSEVELRKMPKKLFADDTNFFRIENPLISRGILALARLLLKKGINTTYIKTYHVLHIALHLATLGWSKVSRGCVMSQFEYVIIECHEELFNNIGDEYHDVGSDTLLRRCEWLNAFLTSSILPPCQRLIDIQENICRNMVFHQPCNEFYLINLGMVLLKKADMYPYKHPRFSENIKHAILTFRTALEQNERPIIGPPVSYILGLSWFRMYRLNYFTKKAPIVICESFRLLDIDLSSSVYNTDYEPNQLKTNTSRVKAEGSPSKSKLEQPKRSSLIHRHMRDDKCRKQNMTKHLIHFMNKKKPLTSKQLSSEKISIFQFCHRNTVKPFADRRVSKGGTPAFVAMNPPTFYSRLMLGRTFRSNHQYLEAVKCFNFIRKVTPSLIMKGTVNREIIEILMECENYNQALEFIAKIHVSENKISSEDISLCVGIMNLLLKMQLFHDERLEKYCYIVAKHEGLDSIKEALLENNLTNLLERVTSKILF